MPQIVYCGPYDQVDVPAFRLAGVAPGVPIEVSDEAAASLLAQPDNWQAADVKASAKALTGKEG